jgi:hypothetical protein
MITIFTYKYTTIWLEMELLTNKISFHLKNITSHKYRGNQRIFFVFVFVYLKITSFCAILYYSRTVVNYILIDTWILLYFIKDLYSRILYKSLISSTPQKTPNLLYKGRSLYILSNKHYALHNFWQKKKTTEKILFLCTILNYKKTNNVLDAISNYFIFSVQFWCDHFESNLYVV